MMALPVCRSLSRWAFVFFLLAFLLSAQPVYAQFTDPFAEGGSWVSLDQFDEQQAVQEETAAQAALAPSAPEIANPAKTGEKNAELAAPVRPLNLSPMPALSPRYTFTVSSSQDQEEEWYKERMKWQTFEEVDREAAEQTDAQKLVSILGRDPFKVRFALLPSAAKAIVAERASKSADDREKQAEKKIEDPKIAEKQKKTNEACEVFTEYRRRQLEAMESDRQTLSALQSALAELGLSGDLGFMTKTGSTLSSSASVDETNGAVSGIEATTKMP